MTLEHTLMSQTGFSKSGKTVKEVNKNFVGENFEWSYGSGLVSSQLTSAMSEKRKFLIVIKTGTLLTLFCIDQRDAGQVMKLAEDECTDSRNYFELI